MKERVESGVGVSTRMDDGTRPDRSKGRDGGDDRRGHKQNAGRQRVDASDRPRSGS